MTRFRLAATPLAVAACAALLLGGCATQPLGPTARVLPAPGKPFEVFAQDQSLCKGFADGEVAGGAEVANLKQFGAAALSVALGAGLGAATAGGQSNHHHYYRNHHHNQGQNGPATGAAIGAIAGAISAGRGSSVEQGNLQGRYDTAYTQCMFSRGNQIPGMTPAPSRRVAAVAARSPFGR